MCLNEEEEDDEEADAATLNLLSDMIAHLCSNSSTYMTGNLHYRRLETFVSDMRSLLRVIASILINPSDGCRRIQLYGGRGKCHHRMHVFNETPLLIPQ